MAMNALQRALVKAGLAEKPKERKRRNRKKFTCHKCGAPMIQLEDTNIMVCSKEDKNHTSFFIFDR